MAETVAPKTSNGYNGGARRDLAEETWREAYGASQIGPFDYCPRLGFREYWYPGIEVKRVPKNKPARLTMLGEEICFFRGSDGKVVALNDWCPHRGARLSLGVCEFPGTITCPYHGYTFDAEGQCVAGLIDHPESPLVGKMRSHKYPTQEWQGIVFVWMGETEPVPLEDDMPPPLVDANYTGRRYMRVRDWEVNWTEPVIQGIDFHEYYLHRWANVWRIFHKNLGFFRPKPVYQGNVRVADERDNAASFRISGAAFGQAYYPGVDAKWPVKVWWRRLPTAGTRRRSSGAPVLVPEGGTGNSGFAAADNGVRTTRKLAAGIVLSGKAVQLPSIIYFHRGGAGEVVQMRWGVPILPDTVRMWTFNAAPRPKTIFGSAWQAFWYYFWRLPSGPVATNDKEDLAVFKKTRLNLEAPQKLGPLDTGVIYFRRHLARRARDYQRLGWVKGVRREAPVEQPAHAQETIAGS